MLKNAGWFIPALVLLALATLRPAPAAAQDWMQPEFEFAQRMDFRDLGYPLVNEVPHNNCAITSLLAASNRKVYGATTGDTAYLFVFDPRLNKVRHLGRVAEAQSVHHALVEDGQGLIYLGTGLNPFTPLELSTGGTTLHVDSSLAMDLRKHFAGYPGGQLYVYDPSRSDHTVKLEGEAAELTSLGTPVPGNSIYCLAADPKRGRIYGVSYPDGKFFYYDLAAKAFKTVCEIDSQMVFHGPERDLRSLPRALFVDPGTGRVFTSGLGGNLVYFDPSFDKIVLTGAVVPGDRYRFESITHPVAEGFARARDGWVYGGSSDGHLFRFDPSTLRLDNLGKARSERRLRCLAAATDGSVYMFAGERKGALPCKLFRFDPQSGSYTDMGTLVVDRSPYYHWRGYQFDAMTAGPDGTLYFGESERCGHLWIFMP